MFYTKPYQIKWSNRLHGSGHLSHKVSVDGTDCRIAEPSPFSTDWFCHKFKSAGVRYEVAVSVTTGYIVWVHGPYPCGSHPDVRIFRLKLKNKLLPSERVIADQGYRDNRCDYLPDDLAFPDKLYFKCRARHENANKRIKQFNVAAYRFRHEKSLHGICFHAAANLAQLMIENGSPLFSI